nr:PREDICTED: cytokinin dehydrogenase 3-like [Musa acuminata subsp. malaccensis]
MHLPLILELSTALLSILLVFFFRSSNIFFKLPANLSFQVPVNLTSDYGRIIHGSPAAVLKPSSPDDISLLLKSIYSSPLHNDVTVAARGTGHSTHGQALAPGGFVIDMRSLPLSITIVDGDGTSYVDAGGGALWIDVLNETLRHGLSPRSWTDYLYLTVGGTLSVGGISGQTFKQGPQISNVVEMDVVTGKGEIVQCSEQENSDLFHGVLGGLGQLGIITRARIKLRPAPPMVAWIRVKHHDFDQFTRHGELVVNSGEVDYLEGFIKFGDAPQSHQPKNAFSRFGAERCVKPRQPTAYYLLEMAIYYDDDDVSDAAKKRAKVLARVSSMTSVEILEVSYLDFLNRVREEELSLRRMGLWDVPHPWMNLFVPRSQIRRFHDLFLRTMSDSCVNGPIIMYPTLRHQWNLNTSIVVPQDEAGEDVFYVVSVLRAAPPICTVGSSCLDGLMQQNEQMIRMATARGSSHGGGGMGAKQYMPYLRCEEEWREHFGQKWKRFEELKSKFDPLNVLAPGQRIFKRRKPLKASAEAGEL